MYTVTVEAGFSAVHRLRLQDGTLEPQHGHDWCVRIQFVRGDLDGTGMVIDFDKARSAVQSVVAKLHHGDLNNHEGLAGRNPTAEVVARYIFERLTELRLATIRRVEVTEAPGCLASYEPYSSNANTE